MKNWKCLNNFIINTLLWFHEKKISCQKYFLNFDFFMKLKIFQCRILFERINIVFEGCKFLVEKLIRKEVKYVARCHFAAVYTGKIITSVSNNWN